MKAIDIQNELAKVLFTEAEIQNRLKEIAAEIDAEYADKDVLLVGVLNGALMVMADLSRNLKIHCETDWMAISSYGAGTQSSGIVRILKDLSTTIKDRHVLVVEDIVDTGLTLHYLLENLRSREPASLNLMTLLRKPEALQAPVDVKWVGFDIPKEFVVGYGLDYAGKYRNLRDIGVLDPKMYS